MLPSQCPGAAEAMLVWAARACGPSASPVMVRQQRSQIPLHVRPHSRPGRTAATCIYIVIAEHASDRDRAEAVTLAAAAVIGRLPCVCTVSPEHASGCGKADSPPGRSSSAASPLRKTHVTMCRGSCCRPLTQHSTCDRRPAVRVAASRLSCCPHTHCRDGW